ncbi:ribosomal protein S5 domain 2-type protein [Ephemerocybe angulata]|uniref:Ribosomal RNA-processing protein 42 n=1 Tax=Ephemerocybe angulata TaxID=980116 RepID=A0A8H6I358_9AGAR|nr:ribosomal protein S5 domain 2-type protein [Tulosesus angulatus]
MASSSISKAESAYIEVGLSELPPQRLDGRALTDYRAISLETGTAPLANGSARLTIGRNPHDGSGGTEILAATKLEVETNEDGGSDQGRVVCSVTCSPAAYPHLSSNALEDLQHDLTTVMHTTLSHPSLHPDNLKIIPGKKSWLLSLDLVILSDAGNIYDALFMAARAALWDTKVPRTRFIEFKAKKGGPASGGKGRDGMDVDETATSGFDTRKTNHATDFELLDYWDEGEVLDGRDRWPLCVTFNLVPKTHFLDATQVEEAVAVLKVLFIFASSSVQGMRMLGPGEVTSAQIKSLLKEAETHSRNISSALDSKLKDEDVRRNQKASEAFSQQRR